MLIDYRLAESDDHPATYGVFTAASRELLDRHNFPFGRTSQIPPRFLAFRRYAYEFHHDSYWVAEADSRVVGFGIATRHEGMWYVGALHVLPEFQGEGVGRRLLELMLSSTARPSDSRCVISDPIQPISSAIYVRAGMLPWVPVFGWEGPMPKSLPDPPEDTYFRVGVDLQQLDNIDKQVLGIQRRVEHEFWHKQPDLECGVLWANGQACGYAYVSDKGELGPAATIAEPFMEPLVLGAASRLNEKGAERITLKLPGQSPSVQSAIRSLGLRISGRSMNLLASRPLWPTGQYLISAGDALL